MLSAMPSGLDRLAPADVDREILRAGLIAELDAINLYEQMAARTANALLKKLLLDIAREEKTHVGEFLALLRRLDQEQERELAAGAAEVEEMSE